MNTFAKLSKSHICKAYLKRRVGGVRDLKTLSVGKRYIKMHVSCPSLISCCVAVYIDNC